MVWAIVRIIVLVALILGFFGGLGYLLWKLCANRGLVTLKLIGILLIPVVSYSIAINILDKITQKETLKWILLLPFRILLKAEKYSLLAIMATGPYFYYYIYGHHVMAYIMAVFIVLAGFLLAVSYVVVRWTNNFRAKIRLRQDAYVLMIMAAVINFVVSLLWSLFHIKVLFGQSDLEGTRYMIYAVLGKTIELSLFYVIYLASQMELSKSPEKFVLYLRSFKFDKSEQNDEILRMLEVVDKETEVLRVGNPRTLFDTNSSCKTYYLNSTDWQVEVRKLMSKTQHVVSVIDNTEGILWELFNNYEMRWKIVYVVYDLTRLKYLMTLEQYEDARRVSPQLGEVLEALVTQAESKDAKQLAFVCEDNQWWCSTSISGLFAYRIRNEQMPVEAWTVV